MLSSKASALLCLAVGQVHASDCFSEATCGLELLQYEATAEGACKGWCSGNAQPWTSKCTWNTCAGCEICDSIVLPTKRPTPAPTQKVEGCAGWCAGNAAAWESKCGWKTCEACADCDSTVPPTKTPTPAPTPKATAEPTTEVCFGGWLPGDGNGKTEEYIVSTPDEDACIRKVKQEEPEANGATYSTSGNRCYAEFGATGYNPSSSWKTCLFPQQTPEPTEAPTAAPTPCDNSDLCRDVGHNCCGVDWLTMTCAEGYEPEVVGACGVIGGQTAFTCKLKEHDDSMCDGIVGDKCCGIDGASVNCKYGYEAVPTGNCGVIGLRTKFTCKRPELDDSKCDSGLLDACCGVKGVTAKCKEGYVVVETGSCGVPGIEARTKYSCKPRCSP